MVYRSTLQTRQEGFYDVTSKVSEAVRESGVTDGICVVFCPPTRQRELRSMRMRIRMWSQTCCLPLTKPCHTARNFVISKEIPQPIWRQAIWEAVQRLSLKTVGSCWEDGRVYISVSLTDRGLEAISSKYFPGW